MSDWIATHNVLAWASGIATSLGVVGLILLAIFAPPAFALVWRAITGFVSWFWSTRIGVAVMVGGGSIAENGDKALLNPYGVIPVNPEKHPGVNFDLATQFANWITSVEAQQLISDFGRDKFGQSLFYPSSDAWMAAHP